jgi:hypothetical protein
MKGPQLSLISVRGDPDKTVNDLAVMFEKITGRKPTADELAKAREMLRAATK